MNKQVQDTSRYTAWCKSTEQCLSSGLNTDELQENCRQIGLSMRILKWEACGQCFYIAKHFIDFDVVPLVINSQYSHKSLHQLGAGRVSLRTNSTIPGSLQIPDKHPWEAASALLVAGQQHLPSSGARKRSVKRSHQLVAAQVVRPERKSQQKMLGVFHPWEMKGVLRLGVLQFLKKHTLKPNRTCTTTESYGVEVLLCCSHQQTSVFNCWPTAELGAINVRFLQCLSTSNHNLHSPFPLHKLCTQHHQSITYEYSFTKRNLQVHLGFHAACPTTSWEKKRSVTLPRDHPAHVARAERRS